MSPQPNILLILADELRADHLACFGNHIVRTPVLDRLAHSGTRFDQCMIPHPTCTPCRASILTGCFPSALRSRMVGCRTPDDARFLPRVLGAAGYHTASIGKIHLVPQGAEPEAVLGSRQPDGRLDYYGFQEVDLVNGHGANCFGPAYTPWLEQRVPDLKDRLSRREALCSIRSCQSWPLPPEVHSSEYIADKTIDFLQRAADESRPFFLHCSFPDPHHPFTVPEPYASMYAPADMPEPLPPITESTNPPPIGLEAYLGRNYSQHRPDGRPCDRVIGTPPVAYSTFSPQDWRIVRAITAGMTSLLDNSIGRILDALDTTNLAQNTIVVFATDHGDYLGDYGLFGKGLHYDCVLRSPLIMRGPGIPCGQVESRIASLVDLAPTLLDLAGVPEPAGTQGFSMKPGLAGTGPWCRDAALSENDDDMAPMRLRTLTTADWKLSIYAGSEFGELYDRQADPHERRNLWNDPAYTGIQAALTARLADHMLCAIDGANGRTQPPSPPIAKHTPLRLHNIR